MFASHDRRCAHLRVGSAEACIMILIAITMWKHHSGDENTSESSFPLSEIAVESFERISRSWLSCSCG